MPHGESWFSYLPFYENLVHAAHALGWPVNDEGVTWVGGAHVGIQHVLNAVFVVLILLAFGLITRSKVKDTAQAVVPDDKFNIRNVVEILFGTVYKMMSDIMGAKAARFFLPLIGTCAFFILFSNALGLIPGFLPPTDNLNTTFACASVIFFATHIFGVKEHGLAYFKHFFGPIIKWYALPLMILMLAIEIISHLARPATLALRLAANMTADHMVLTLFLGLVPFVVPIPMYALGIIVVMVQALVFCLLSTVYISMAVAHDDH